MILAHLLLSNDRLSARHADVKILLRQTYFHGVRMSEVIAVPSIATDLHGRGFVSPGRPHNPPFERGQENVMLSPHEIATLMLVKDAPCRIEPVRAELHALLDFELVRVERIAPGLLLAHVTPRGDAVLQAIARSF